VNAERFGQLLRRYRIAAGFSQERVAEDARLSVVSISALERGLRRAPYRHTVERIVAALGLNEEQAKELEAAAAAARGGGLSARSGVPKAREIGLPKTTSFVGRAMDLAHIARLVTSARLVTIAGAGGVGKTRLAFEAAAEVRDAAGPPLFVDLETAASGPMVCAAIASAVANALVEPLEPEALARLFGAKRLMLVLDTCEHVLPEVAQAVVAILRSCPGVSVLATSRQRVGVSGEVVYKLRPLPIPPEAVTSLREAQTYASVDLFIRRAMASEHPISFTNGNAEAVAGICRVLDGIPLLIEVAAARAGTLGLGPLAGRLREGLEPVNVNRDAPPRHRTSLASLTWSYRLLTSGERRVFELLSAFPGTFTLHEAEGVCAAAGLDESSVSEALSSLVEKNLVEVGATGGSTYHSMLNTVRRFASRRRLDSVTNAP